MRRASLLASKTFCPGMKNEIHKRSGEGWNGGKSFLYDADDDSTTARNETEKQEHICDLMKVTFSTAE